MASNRRLWVTYRTISFASITVAAFVNLSNSNEFCNDYFDFSALKDPDWIHMPLRVADPTLPRNKYLRPSRTTKQMSTIDNPLLRRLTKVSQTLELNIEGMTCANCVRQVTDALKDVPGVHVLEVGIGTAKLSIDEGTDESAALDAVRSAGYEPNRS